MRLLKIKIETIVLYFELNLKIKLSLNFFLNLKVLKL